MIVKIQFEGKVTRVYDEERNSRTTHYIVVSEQNCREGFRPIVLRFKAMPESEAARSIHEGDVIDLSAYVDGRDWVSPKTGDTMYFVDLNINEYKILVAAAKPTKAGSWPELLEVAKCWGVSEDDVKKMCSDFVAANNIKARKNTNCKMIPTEFQGIADSIVMDAENGPAPDMSDGPGDCDDGSDDVPF